MNKYRITMKNRNNEKVYLIETREGVEYHANKKFATIFETPMDLKEVQSYFVPNTWVVEEV